MASRYPLPQADKLTDGLPVVEWLTLGQIRDRFATSQKRAWLFEGFVAACIELRKWGCAAVYLGGSYVDEVSEEPGDYDACFDTVGLMSAVDEVFYLPDLEQERRAKYRGDWLPARLDPGAAGRWLRFLGKRRDGEARHLIGLKLRLNELMQND